MFSKKYLVIYLILIGCFFIIFLHVGKITSEKENLWTQDQMTESESQADCAVVLTGAPGRIREGVELLQQKRIKKLIVSGVYREATMEELFPYWPYYSDISFEDIILEKRSQTTFGNAHQSVVLVESLKCQDIYLITSQLHMARAYAIFYEVFPKSIVIKKLTLPNTRSEQSWLSFAVELVKSIFYSTFGLVNLLEV